MKRAGGITFQTEGIMREEGLKWNRFSLFEKQKEGASVAGWEGWQKVTLGSWTAARP